jgi:hypothetical protein
VPDPASAVLASTMTPGISEPLTFLEDLIRPIVLSVPAHSS